MHSMQETEETEMVIEITMRLKSVNSTGDEQSSHKQRKTLHTILLASLKNTDGALTRLRSIRTSPEKYCPHKTLHLGWGKIPKHDSWLSRTSYSSG